MPLPLTNSVVDTPKSLVFPAGAVPSLFGQAINDLTPLIGGTADGGCLVLISIGGAVFGVTTSHTGEWSLDTGMEVPLAGQFDLGVDGCKKLVIIAVDGHGRSCVVEGVFTVLTAAPEIPTLATTRVLRHSPLLDGHAEPGSLVSITFGGAVYLTTAASSGAWSIDTTNQEAASGRLELGADGRREVVIVCTDLAGNTSSASAWVVLVTRANMSRLAFTALPRAPENNEGLPLLSDIGRAWRSALEAWRGGVQGG